MIFVLFCLKLIAPPFFFIFLCFVFCFCSVKRNCGYISRSEDWNEQFVAVAVSSSFIKKNTTGFTYTVVVFFLFWIKKKNRGPRITSVSCHDLRMMQTDTWPWSHTSWVTWCNWYSGCMQISQILHFQAILKLDLTWPLTSICHLWPHGHVKFLPFHQ